MMTDEQARVAALDVRGSFIVQAPAGSGKTELLIQRYLALLGHVDIPEEVLAITFTRKAAAEMRRRVLEALAEADRGEPPQAAHKRTTYRLARKALARSRAREWLIDVQPQRLRIETVDSLNVWLAKHLSLLAGGIGAADIVDDARFCYDTAAARVLDSIGDGSELSAALTQLLQAADNNVMRLERMLRDLLPTRDQWLPYLTASDDGELRAVLESAMRRLVDESLQRVYRVLPSEFLDQVEEILRDLATQPAAADPLAVWRLPTTALKPSLDCLDAWRAVPELLLTQARHPGWRKKPASAVSTPTLERFDRLRAEHAHDSELRDALLEIRGLPDPTYSERDWTLVGALRLTLRHLVAELKVIFGERHCADFVEVALSAQQALGRVDRPSELLLALDRRLSHILVDEFQDTSHTQFRLLKLLMAGWQASDGRTAFLVGDPMQSIYRFRHADMSLFLKAQAAGIADIALTPLVLEQNFRSAPAIVEWTNQAFVELFPATDDMGTGAARFNASRATRSTRAHQGVCWHALRGRSSTAEIQRVAEILREELSTHSPESTAVLVRSRSHLIGLREQLRARGISAHAVELEPLKQRQIVQDLIGLCRALTHLGDRIAWLAVLRAPWCGLSWRDIEIVASASVDSTIWTELQSEALLAKLSDDGRDRARHVTEVLRQAFAERADRAFDRWVERTWVSLEGPSCVEHDDDIQGIEAFFATLAGIGTRGDLPDPAALEDAFAEPHGQGDSPRATGIEIMTIHRAKGLEFDTVVLLGLGRRPRVDSQRALYWHERTAADGSEDFLLGPFSDTAGSPRSLTAFIRQADAVRDHAESTRLLYVATTRARERLHLVGQLPEESKAPPSGSLLAHLWTQARPHFDAAPGPSSEPIETPWLMPPLRRLTEHSHKRPSRPERTQTVDPEFLWASHAAVQVGTLVHGVLHEIATDGVERWTSARIEARGDRFHRELALLGVEERELDRAARRVIDALCAVLADPRGLWLLSEHPEAAAELGITLRTERGLEHLRIDRTFVDEAGLRWIVDYKTSQHTGSAVDAFLDTEVQRYRDQLATYAAAMARIDARPIRVALYFPLLQAFRDWDPAAQEGVDP